MRDILLRGCLAVVDRRNLLHLSSQKADCDLLLGEFCIPRIVAARLCQDDDLTQIVEVGSSGTSHHLIKVLNRKPFDAHRKCIEDYLRGGEVYAGGKCRCCDNRRYLAFLEFLFDIAPFLCAESGMIRHRFFADGFRNLVAPRPRICKDYGLTAETL